MPLQIVGPVIVIAVNLCLGIWALIARPRDPAYRAFALLGFSLAIWNLGGQVFYHGGSDQIWVWLSFLGMALAPANFLCLVLAVRQRSTQGAYWHLLFYLPVLATGLLLGRGPTGPAGPSVQAGFYDLGALTKGVFAAISLTYLTVAVWLSLLRLRRRDGDGRWLFGQFFLPLLVGAICVMGVAWLKHDPTAPVALWVMIISQYAMFMMIRHRLVRINLGLRSGVRLVVSAVFLAACVALFLGLFGMLFGKRLGQETSFVLVVSIVSVCVLYAAIQTRLEDLFDRVFKRKR